MVRLVSTALFLVLCACDRSLPKAPAAAIAHAGVGTGPEHSDGPRKAVDAALAALEAGADPLDAAVAGAVILEDDPRFNAGTGSRVRIDGVTVQMDASLMRSDGTFAAVAAIERVKNPIQVARAVMDTPHLFLAGEGATAFARTIGMPDYDPATEAAREKARKIQAQLRERHPELPDAWEKFDYRKHWNFTRTLQDAGLDAGSDTVGVVVRTADGRFASALSTGGTSITLRGRVGDVPIYGAGLWAGPAGGCAATGEGERIIEAALAREVHGWLAAGATAQRAADRASALIEKRGDIGIVVLSKDGLAAASSKPMAWAARESGSTEWLGPAPRAGHAVPSPTP